MRRAGAARPLLRDWVRRVLARLLDARAATSTGTPASASRAGTSARRSALAQGALIGIAAERELQPSRALGRVGQVDARPRADRDYVALAEREDRFPDAARLRRERRCRRARGNAYLAAARYAANAHACAAGRARPRAASEPPALYSFDPDTGRLAVTTPAYNTAIVPINHRSMPYGGLDLARLFDGRQEVAANIGGTGANAFGLTVARSGRTVLRTQYGGRAAPAGVTPLTLVRAPRGAGVTARTRELRAYAGPFTDLRVRGAVAARGPAGHERIPLHAARDRGAAGRCAGAAAPHA